MRVARKAEIYVHWTFRGVFFELFLPFWSTFRVPRGLSRRLLVLTTLRLWYTYVKPVLARELKFEARSGVFSFFTVEPGRGASNLNSQVNKRLQLGKPMFRRLFCFNKCLETINSVAWKYNNTYVNDLFDCFEAACNASSRGDNQP